MSVLAHPGPFAFQAPRRRNLTLVPPTVLGTAGRPDPSGADEAESNLADVIAFPTARSARRSQPAVEVSAAAKREGVEAPLRLTTRGRAVLAGLAVVAAAVVGCLAGALASTGEAVSSHEVVTVTAGDSLWSIAAEVAGPGEDVRDVMSQIASMNELEGAVLAAGQQLRIPGND